MAITTANELRTAVQNWCNDASGGIVTTDRMNEFIVIAEAMFNRTIRTKGMEATMSPTALDDVGTATLPTGFLAWKELRYDGDPDYTLQPRSLEYITGFGTANTDPARYFAINSTSVLCRPVGGSIRGTYYKALTSLSGLTTTGNWLLTSHPDLYLAAVLTEAHIFLNDDPKTQMWRQRTIALLDELMRSDERDDFDGGILTIRAR